jgi:hypothetical protein
MSEFTPNEEGRKEELAKLSELIEVGKAKIIEERKAGDESAEELAQFHLNELKKQRFELLDEEGREELLINGVGEFASGYEELVEMGMPIDMGVIKLDVYGDSEVEISEELETKFTEYLEQFEWWRESEHFDE